MELKPCPFCGGEGHIIKTDFGNGYQKYYHGVCLDCGMETKNYVHITKEEAIEAWNRRADNG